jgi:hypothetical protein
MGRVAETHLELRNVKGQEIQVVRVITRLGSRPVNTTLLVFDTVGRDHYLSEFHMKGMDGFAFNGAPGKHTHEGIEPRK